MINKEMKEVMSVLKMLENNVINKSFILKINFNTNSIDILTIEFLNESDNNTFNFHLPKG